MSKRKQPRKATAKPVDRRPVNPPEPRPVFHTERRPSALGDYEVRIALDPAPELVGSVVRQTGAKWKCAGWR